MALFARDYNEIIRQAQDRAKENTLINVTGPGTKLGTILEILAQLNSSAYEVFDTNTALGFVYGANGKYLDYLGDIFGLTRLGKGLVPISSKDMNIQLTKKDGSNFDGADNIPVGTKFWAKLNGENIYFESTEPAIGTGKEIYISVIPTIENASSNIPARSLVYNNTSKYNSTNLYAITSYYDIEDDENFRYRIINERLSSAKGNLTSIRLAALSTPGVADCEITQHMAGIGTVGVIVKSTTPRISSELLERVEDNIAKVQSCGDKIIVVAPKYTDIDIIIKANYKTNLLRNGEQLESINSIRYLIDNLDIGEPLYTSDIDRLILLDNMIKDFTVKVNATYTYTNNISTTFSVTGSYKPNANEKLISGDIRYE